MDRIIDKKKLGIIGGMGSVAAAYTFKRIIELTPAKTDQDYLDIVLHNNSCVPDRTQGILFNGKDPVPELARSIRLLDQSGVDFIIFACITSHFYIPRLRQVAQATIIDAIEETARHINEKHGYFKKIGIIASTGTIQSGIFHRALEAYDFEGVVLRPEDQKTYFMEPVYSEWGIKAGYLAGEPTTRLTKAVDILKGMGAQAVISGCTEVPLVIKPENFEIPIIDVIDIMAKVSINRCSGARVYDI
jgi:aspartate racemase